MPGTAETYVLFRGAVAEDSAAVGRLNALWVDAHRRGDLTGGFLLNAFSQEQVVRLIEAGEVVVATVHRVVVGYYLTNSCWRTPALDDRERLISAAVADGRLPRGRYVYLTQSAVDPSFTRRGIARRLLSELRAHVSDRFDYLVGYIDAENPAAQAAHARAGWVCGAPYGNGWLAITPTREATARRAAPLSLLV